jgi:hypothetical protein
MTFDDGFRRRLVASLAIVAGVGACLSSENVDLGRNIDSGTLVGADLDGSLAPDATAPFLVAALSVTMGTICRGVCVQMAATPLGAPGPYTYAWGQGLGEGPGPKTVCPLATTTYSVVVSSTSNGQQSTGSATITVVDCDAGGAFPPPADDANGSPPPTDTGTSQSTSASLCLTNASFEGTPAIGTSGPPGIPATAAPPGWQVCLGDPDVDPSVSLLPASQGKTYVGLTVGTGTFAGATAESLGATLCAPLKAGTRYSFCVDVGIGVQGVMVTPPGPGAPGPTLQIWGGTTACNQGQLLWTSPAITNRDSWTTDCGMLFPSQDFSGLSLIPAQASGSGAGFLSYVIVDNIVPGP